MQPPERYPDTAAAAAASPPASLTADPDRFSEAAWELLLAGQDQARRWRHGQLDVEHLLQVLFQDPRYAPWIDPLPLDSDRLLDRIEAFCADQPGAAGEELFVGDALEDLLEAADRRRAGWGSRLIDVPHLLLALLDEPRIGGSLLAAEGLSEERLLRLLRPEAGSGARRLAVPSAGVAVADAASARAAAAEAEREDDGEREADDWIDTAPPLASPYQGASRTGTQAAGVAARTAAPAAPPATRPMGSGSVRAIPAAVPATGPAPGAAPEADGG